MAAWQRKKKKKVLPYSIGNNPGSVSLQIYHVLPKASGTWPRLFARAHCLALETIIGNAASEQCQLFPSSSFFLFFTGKDEGSESR